MNRTESFPNSLCAEQMQLAERELSAFLGAVTELFGPEQARAAEDWLYESAVMDNLPHATSRDWRAVTIAATARLVSRRNVPLSSSETDRQVSDRNAAISDTIVQSFRHGAAVLACAPQQHW
jgi:hypothetical protein